MEKSEGTGKRKKLLVIVGIWLVLGIIDCAVIVVKSLGEEGSLQQQVVAENVENEIGRASCRERVSGHV